MNQFLKASNNPLDDINAIAYEGQPIENRMYKQGYEKHFELLPVLTDDDPMLAFKIIQSKAVMNDLAVKLMLDKWTPTLKPLEGGFNRTILALEAPAISSVGKLKEGQEIVIARWGDGKTSPVHGHADGLLYEQLLFGKMRVNTYRIVDHEKRIARPVETKIFKDFVNIASSYTRKQEHERSALVHNFTSIGYSASLHYVPEHTRDGRDNKFTVERFEDLLIPSAFDYTQLNAQQGLEQLRIGDVALVRSENVPEYGDHFIVITGRPILKEHGLRPQDIAIHSPSEYARKTLDYFTPIMGLTLLKMSDELATEFREFHGIDLENGKISFPHA